MSPLKSITSSTFASKKTVSKGKEKSKGAVVAGRHLSSAQKVPPCPKWVLLLFRALTLKRPNCRPFQRGNSELLSIVFEASNTALRKPQVALKVINTSNLTSEERKVDLPKELTALIEVKHRYVVRVYDIFRHHEHVFIFIELVVRCNQNCFKQAAAVNSFLRVSTKAGKPSSPSSLSSLTIEALTCRRRKFQLAVIVDVAGSGSSEVAYYSTEFFVHNSSKMQNPFFRNTTTDLKRSQKKVLPVSSTSVATANTFKTAETEHSKGLLTVSAKISLLKSSIGKLTELNSITSSTFATASTTAKSSVQRARKSPKVLWLLADTSARLARCPPRKWMFQKCPQAVETVMKKTSVKKNGTKATKKATYVLVPKSSFSPPFVQRQKTAGKGGIGSQPKMKSNQKKVPFVSSVSVATAKISGPPKLQFQRAKKSPADTSARLGSEGAPLSKVGSSTLQSFDSKKAKLPSSSVQYTTVSTPPPPPALKTKEESKLGAAAVVKAEKSVPKVSAPGKKSGGAIARATPPLKIKKR
ncbi:hypothetical protein TYRP_015896 [Tyrophagus putrescentiae]|nr:hypothetical protein TYRP_015896 [Tyrophagus putrescentiae]